MADASPLYDYVHPDDAKFTERVVFRAHPRFVPLYDYAAERLGMTVSEWLRAAAVKQLEAQGVDVQTGQAIEQAGR